MGEALYAAHGVGALVTCRVREIDGEHSPNVSPDTHDKWVREYGTTWRFQGFGAVSIHIFCSLDRLLNGVPLVRLSIDDIRFSRSQLYSQFPHLRETMADPETTLQTSRTRRVRHGGSGAQLAGSVISHPLSFIHLS